MTPVQAADFLRGIMVSACALILGFSLAGTLLMAHGRSLGRTYTIPTWVNVLFVIGYNTLLVAVIINRWNAIGLPVTVSSAVAAVGLSLNVISVLAYSWYISKETN